MPLRLIRPHLGAAVAAFSIATGGAANAGGVTLIQQADGSARTYLDVNIRMAGHTLWLRSADHHGVLKIVSGACSFTGAVQRCLPYAVSLSQDGKTHQIAISHGSVIVNTSDAAQQLPHSSEGLAPHTVLVLLHTERGTYVTAKGELDEVTP